MTAKTQFFTLKPVAEALDEVREAAQPSPRPETLATAAALGRVLATAPRAPHDLPSFTRSSMDGYAVRAADTFGASGSLPAYLTVVGSIQMGQAATCEVGPGQAAEIHTGAMLPPGADAVVMIEKTQPLNAREIEVLGPVAPGENLVQVGEDVAQGAEVLPAGWRLRPPDIGGLLAVGITQIQVVAPPRVAILGSGDEIVPPEHTPAPGQIRDINSYTLAALCAAHGAEPLTLGIAPDDADALYTLAQQAHAQADIVVLTAGSSVSARDLTAETINKLGAPGVLQHGLAVKPGKPTLLAVCGGKPVVGLPGNPVSAYAVARQVLVPLIQHWLGTQPGYAAQVSARLTANVASTTGRVDTVPVRLHESEDGRLAEPIFGKSNLIYTLVNADGVIEVPLNSNGLKAGTDVDVVLL
ncbi:MAG: gephyrin-like molybdotransferase Glp [Anaerolineales bacterium]